MPNTSFDLDERLKRYWLENRDQEQASAIIQEALSQRPTAAKQARRALQVMSELELQLSPRLQGLIGEFRDYVALLGQRLAQVDAIGNTDTEPTAALFEVLGEASEALELEGFDPARLHQSRLGAASRADAAASLLDAFGWERLPQQVAEELKRAIDDLRSEQSHYRGQALFVDGDDRGFVLGVQVVRNKSGVFHAAARVDDAMSKQAEIALREALGGKGADWDIEWPFPYEGESIGLGLYVAALIEMQQLPPDALTAATGRIEVGGHVRGVGGIATKLEAARASGIRRVVLSEENRQEADAAPASADLELIYVDRASAVRAKILDTSSGRAELGFEGSIRLARSLLPLYGLALEDERAVDHGHRLDVADRASSAIITIYSGRRGSVVVGGPQRSARAAAEQLVADHFKTQKPTAQPNRTYRIPTPARQAEAQRLLTELGAAELEPTSEYERWRLRVGHGAANATVVLYTSNKCLLQGQSPAYEDAAAAIEKALEGLGGGDGDADDGSVSRTAVAPPELPDVPHIGTDESGKGDYFGPLVSAAVFVTPEIGAELKALGVRDSKRMTDKAVRALAPKLRRLLDGRYAITAIGPKRYNQLYGEMRAEGKNLNTLLAWGHARSLEDLLGKGVKPQFAVVDQFADARYIEQKILADTRQSGLEIKQFPKAEADIAVAAASVLARESFLEWLERESARVGITLPKGASPQVIEAARKIVARDGRERLGELAKLSFKTTEKVFAA
jgi:ribonuclease HIII